MFGYLSENNIEIFLFSINIADDLSYLGFTVNNIQNINHKYKCIADEFDLELTLIDNNIFEKVKKIDSILDDINDISGNSFENYSEDIYIKIRNDIISSIINALKDVKKEITIDVSSIIFFVTMFSADDRLSIENLSSKKLNDNHILEDFNKRSL